MINNKIFKSVLLFIFSLSLTLIASSASAYWSHGRNYGYHGGGVRVNVGPVYRGYYRGYYPRGYGYNYYRTYHRAYNCAWIPGHMYRGYWVHGRTVCGYRY